MALGAFKCFCPPLGSAVSSREQRQPKDTARRVPSISFPAEDCDLSLVEPLTHCGSARPPLPRASPMASRHRHGGLSCGRRARGPALWVLPRSHHQQAQGPKRVPAFPSKFFGWPNNYIDVTQTSRRKTNFILCILEPHKNMRLK